MKCWKHTLFTKKKRNSSIKSKLFNGSLGWDLETRGGGREGYWSCIYLIWHMFSWTGFFCSSDGKETACSVGDLGSGLGSGSSPGEGNGKPLQYSCLENSMDRGAWWVPVHGVSKSQTWLSDFHFQQSAGNGFSYSHCFSSPSLCHLISIKIWLSLLKLSKEFGFGIWKKAWVYGWVWVFFFLSLLLLLFSCSVMSDPEHCSTSGFPVHYQLPELAQTQVHRVSDAIQTSHPLLSPSPDFNLFQHQGLFQWVGSSHQVAKLLELQHQSLQWVFRTDFL